MYYNDKLLVKSITNFFFQCNGYNVGIADKVILCLKIQK